jgi:hypothetical protein
MLGGCEAAISSPTQKKIQYDVLELHYLQVHYAEINYQVDYVYQ